MTYQDLPQRLESVRAKRGYLLPHHGLMALTSPALLEKYDGLYEQITLTQGKLSRHLHESVWLAILSSINEVFGTHHVNKFCQAGGSMDELDTILALTALARGYGAFAFAHEHWDPHLPNHNAAEAYLQSFRSVGQSLQSPLPHLIGVATHTCLRNPKALSWHLKSAYADQVDESYLAEAMLMTMLPGSVPNLVAAAGVWRQLVANKEVDASPETETWAQMSGQGGWAEAARRANDKTGDQP